MKTILRVETDSIYVEQEEVDGQDTNSFDIIDPPFIPLEGMFFSCIWKDFASKKLAKKWLEFQQQWSILRVQIDDITYSKDTTLITLRIMPAEVYDKYYGK